MDGCTDWSYRGLMTAFSRYIIRHVCRRIPFFMKHLKYIARFLLSVGVTVAMLVAAF